jgi:WD40 repeat protein
MAGAVAGCGGVAPWLLPSAGLLSAVLLGAGVASGCRDPVRPAVPDTTPPVVKLTYPDPRSGVYDPDSNGLVHVLVSWSDSGGGVDPATVRITCGECLAGAPSDTNLANGWRVVRRDSLGAEFEETFAMLLRAGGWTLSVSVADSAGNRSSSARSYIVLPPGSYHQTIDLQYPPGWYQERGVEVAISPDGRKGLVPFIGGNVAVFDPDGVAPTHYIANVHDSFFAGFVSIDPATGLAYIAGGGGATDGFTILDTRTEQVVRSVWVGAGAASVWVGGGRIFAGEACTSGRVFVYDKTSLALLGRVEVGAVPYDATCVNTTRIVLSADGRQGWGGMVHGDIYSFDATNYALIRRYDLYPPAGDNIYTDVRSLALVGDRWLYVSRIDFGVDEFDTQTGQVTAHYPFATPPYPIVMELALSPDGRTLFASSNPGTVHDTSVSAPLLFTVPGLQLRWTFPTRRGLVDGVAFHPDGKRVYQMAMFGVQVYLIRPE